MSRVFHARHKIRFHFFLKLELKHHPTVVCELRCINLLVCLIKELHVYLASLNLSTSHWQKQMDIVCFNAQILFKIKCMDKVKGHLSVCSLP